MATALAAVVGAFDQPVMRITTSVKNVSETPNQPHNATDEKSHVEEPHKKHLAKGQGNETDNAHCLPARSDEVPRVVQCTDKTGERNDNLDGIANAATLGLLANAIFFSRSLLIRFCALTRQ
ncbi:MAG: hypothetical protein AB7I35_08130 [Ramlibacter sp.]